MHSAQSGEPHLLRLLMSASTASALASRPTLLPLALSTSTAAGSPAQQGQR